MCMIEVINPMTLNMLGCKIQIDLMYVKTIQFVEFWTHFPQVRRLGFSIHHSLSLWINILVWWSNEQSS